MSSLASVRNFEIEPPVPREHSRWALVRAWLPAVLWIGVISFESTSLFTSEHTGHWTYNLLNFLFGPHIAGYAWTVNAIGRKVGHFIGYSVLGALSFVGWMELLAYQAESRLARTGKRLKVPRRWHLRAGVLAVLIVFLVAASDELHQSLIPGRGAAFRDVLLDTMGGVFAQLMILLFWKPEKKTQATTPALESVGTRN